MRPNATDWNLSLSLFQSILRDPQTFRFSSAKKCSNEGRALMQLDFRQFVLKLEAISDAKPLPHQDLVANYVKAYYIPETELDEWVKQHTVSRMFSL